MPKDTAPKSSFSRRRRWGIGFNVVFSLTALLAVVVMVNYLSGRYFHRFYFSTRTQIELHTPTLGLLRSLTNEIRVTLYYNKDDPFYGDMADLLKEYHSKNPKLVVKMVDYERDPGQAQEIKAKYALGSATNVIIFDGGGLPKVVPGDLLVDYKTQMVSGQFDRKPVFFMGEMMFTSALLAVSSNKPFKAYFLQDHGEHRLDDASSDGYTTLAGIFRMNFIDVQPLALLGTNGVPDDCNLLIIAGPASPIADVELDKIDQYLNQGRRLFALFDARSANRETGLEKILAKWSVKVGADLVVDPDKLVHERDIVISAFSQHPLVNPLLGKGLYLTIPRPVSPIKSSAQAADAPKVEVVASTGPNAYLYGDATRSRGYLPVMVVVDKPSVKGVVPEGGATRMIVAGDSFFLSNGQIEKYANRDFVNLAANWLLDRTDLLPGLGPRPVVEYRLLIPRKQMRSLQWIMLGAMPGGVLVLGGLVWLGRRR